MAGSAAQDFYLQKMADMLKLAEIAGTPVAKLEFMRLAEEYRDLYERAKGQRTPDRA